MIIRYQMNIFPVGANRLDLPSVIVPSFKLEWGSSRAKDRLPKGKQKSWIRKFLKLAMIVKSRLR